MATIDRDKLSIYYEVIGTGPRLLVLNSGVPPLGLATQLRVFIDPDLLQYEEVWAAAGTWNDVFAIDPQVLSRITDGKIVEVRR
jgi:hypothetical protein